MATNDSTATTGGANANLIQAASDYCGNMQSFFDLAEREFREHSNTDFDALEFLVKAAKTECFKLSSLVCKIQGAA